MELRCISSLFTYESSASKTLLIPSESLVTKALACFEVRARRTISVRASGLCLCITPRVLSFWHLLELESNHYSHRLRARSRARIDTAMEECSSGSFNPTGELSSSFSPSLISSPSLPETLRSLQQAPGTPRLKRRPGVLAKKYASAASLTRLSRAEDVQESTSSATLVSR